MPWAASGNYLCSRAPTNDLSTYKLDFYMSKSQKEFSLGFTIWRKVKGKLYESLTDGSGCHQAAPALP